jgi:two-component system chemotaxis sensor kinase CheA
MSAEDHAFGELIDEYVVECLPLAERAADALVELERQRRAGGTGDDLLGPVKGWLHTVKGNSAMMGLTAIQEAAHALEDLCAALADKPGEAGHPLLALVVEGGGLLVEQVRAAAGDGTVEGSARWLARAGEAVHHSAPGNGKAADRRRGERRGRGAEADGAANVVRVDFRRLDTLLEVLGEGLIEQAAVAEAFRRVARRAGAVPGVPELDRAILALEKTMKRLEEVVMETRLLPIASVFGRFPRLLRGVAEGVGKRVRLETAGGDTALDKAVLDRLGEPLLHLLTNAVVHGIEAPADRRRGGKPEEGVLRLAAVSRSGRVAIEVADDGRGLDEARILARAEEMGLTAGEGSDPHALIFQPGFSTAAAVSGLAGRGVGLDVAAAAVRALGGTIGVRTRPGEGTAFLLDIPLTLAIVRSLIVEVDQERYAVPIAQVAATVRAEPQALHQINHRGVALWRGGLIQVSDGGALLGTAGRGERGRRFYVVISSGGRRRGILVDRLIGHQDVVVKGLDPALGRPDVVSGTTILGDGRVACILDPVRILERRVPA